MTSGGFRTPDQIANDIKKESETIVNATRRRNELVKELRQLAQTAISYADNAENNANV